MLTVLDNQSWSFELATGNAEFIEVAEGVLSGFGLNFGHGFGQNSNTLFVVSNVRADNTFAVMKSGTVPPDPGPGATFSAAAAYTFPQPNSDFDPVVAYDATGATPAIHIIGTRDSASNPRFVDLVLFHFDTVTGTLSPSPAPGFGYGFGGANFGLNNALISGYSIREAYDLLVLSNGHKLVAVSVNNPVVPPLFAASITAVAINGGFGSGFSFNFGSPGPPNVLTVTAGNAFTPGQLVTLSGLTSATFLNGLQVNVVSATPTQFTAQFIYPNPNPGNPPQPGTYPAAADTGIAAPNFSGTSLIAFELDASDSLVPNSLAVLAHSPERMGDALSSVSLISVDGVNVEAYWEAHPKLITFQDQVFTVNLSRRIALASVTATSISSNVLTVAAGNNFAPGSSVTLSGTAEAFLNGQTVTVLAASPAQFTASFAHADYSNPSDTGFAAPPSPVWDAAPTQLTTFQGRYTDNRLTVLADQAGNRYMAQNFFSQLDHPEGLLGNLILGYRPSGGSWFFHTTLGSVARGSFVQGTLSLSRSSGPRLAFLLQPFQAAPPPLGYPAAYPFHIGDIDLSTLAVTDVPGFYNTLNFTWLRGTKLPVDDGSLWAVVGEKIEAPGPSPLPVYVSLFNVPPVAALAPPSATIFRGQSLSISAAGSTDADQDPLQFIWSKNDPDLRNITLSPQGALASLFVAPGIGGAERFFSVGVAAVDLFSDLVTQRHAPASLTGVQVNGGTIAITASNDFAAGEQIMVFGAALAPPPAPVFLASAPSGVLAQPITGVSVDANGTLTVVASNNLAFGMRVTFSGLTNASFLNGQTAIVQSATPSQFTASTPFPVYGGFGLLFGGNFSGTIVPESSGRANFPPALASPGFVARLAYVNAVGETTGSFGSVSGGIGAGLLPVIQSPPVSGDPSNSGAAAYNVYAIVPKNGTWASSASYAPGDTVLRNSTVYAAARATVIITGITGNGGSGTVNVTAANNFTAGQSVIISGTAHYNGPITIASITGGGAGFTYLQANASASESAGTVAVDPADSGATWQAVPEQRQNQQPILLGENWTQPLSGLIGGQAIPSATAAFLEFLNDIPYTVLPTGLSPSQFQVAADGFGYSFGSNFGLGLDFSGGFGFGFGFDFGTSKNFPSALAVGAIIPKPQFAICNITVPFNAAPTIAFPSPPWGLGTQVNVLRNTLIKLTTGTITDPSTQFPVVINGVSEPDDTPQYQWEQLSGTPVTFATATSQPSVAFNTNGVNVHGEALVFRLTVNDGINSPAVAACTVNVAAYNFAGIDTHVLARSIWNEQENISAVYASSNTAFIAAPNSFAVGQRVAFKDLPGTNASRLNGLALPVTSTLGSAIQASVAQVQRIGTLVTITTELPHGFAPGEIVQTAPVIASDVAGVFVISSTPTATAFTYSTVSSGSIGPISDTGPATVLAQFTVRLGGTGFGLDFGLGFGSGVDFSLELQSAGTVFAPARVSQRNTAKTWGPLFESGISPILPGAIYSDLAAVKRVSVLDGTDRYIVISASSIIVYGGLSLGAALLRRILTPGNTAIIDATHTEDDATLVIDSGGSLFRYSAAPLISTDNPDTTINLSLFSAMAFNRIVTTYSFANIRVIALSGPDGCMLLQVKNDTLEVQGALLIDVASNLLFGANNVQFVRTAGLENLRTGKVFLGTVVNAQASVTNVLVADNAITLSCVNTFKVGDIVALSGFTGSATFLNGLRFKVLGASTAKILGSHELADFPSTPVNAGVATALNDGKTFETLIDMPHGQIIGSWDASKLRNQFVNTGEILFQPDSTYSGQPIPPVQNAPASQAGVVTISWTQQRSDLVYAYNVEYANVSITNAVIDPSTLAVLVPNSSTAAQDLGVVDVSLTPPLTLSAVPANVPPGPGQYSFNVGFYTFNPAQGGHTARITTSNQFQLLQIVNSGTTQKLVISLSPGIYRFRIKAFSLDGVSGYSNIQQITF